MSFENKQKISEIDLGWKKADYVTTKVDEENDDFDKNPENLQFAWFKIDPAHISTEKDEKEKIEAMRVQYQNKIINKYGYPYGKEMPKEVRDMIKEKEKRESKGGSKWDRHRKRIIDRQIEKDMTAERKKETSFIDTLPMSNIDLSKISTETIQKKV